MAEAAVIDAPEGYSPVEDAPEGYSAVSDAPEGYSEVSASPSRKGTRESINEPAPTTISRRDPGLIESVVETFADATRGAVRGVGGVVESGGGASMLPVAPNQLVEDFVTDRLGVAMPGTILRRAGGAIINQIGEKIKGAVAPKKTEGVDLGDPTWWAENLPEVAPQLATQLGLAALTRGQSLAAFTASGGASMAGSQYNSSLEDSKKKGLPEPEARRRAMTEATIVGTIGAALERIPSAEFLTKGPIAKLVGEVLGDSRVINGVARGGAEALTETAQELTSIISEAAVRDEKLTKEKVIPRLKAAAALGAGAGTLASIALDAASAPPTEASPGSPSSPPQPLPQSTESQQEGPPKTVPEAVSRTDITSQIPSIQEETDSSRSWEMAKKEMAAVANDTPPPVTPLTERPPVEAPPDFPMVEEPEAQIASVAASEPPPVAPIAPEPEPVISQAPPVEAGPSGPQPSPEAVEERQPAAAGTVAPEGQTGIRNAITDQVAKAMGLPDIPSPETYGAEQQLADARAEIEGNPKRGSELIAEAIESTRPLSTLETNIVLHEWAARKTAFNRAVERLNNATTEQERVAAEADVKLARLNVQEAHEAAKSFGTEQGRALEARKRFIAEQYELPIMQAELQAAKGDELSPQDEQKVTKLSEDIKKADAEVDAIEEQNAKTDAEALFQNLLVEEGKTAQQQAKAGKSLLDSLKAGHDEALKNIRRRLGQANAGVDPTVLYDVARIGAYHIANGAKKLADFTKKVVAEVGEWIRPNIQEVFDRSKEIHDANQSAFGTPAKAKKGKKPVNVAALAKADAEKGELSHRTAYEVVRQKIQQGVEGFDNVMQAATDDLAKLIPGVDLRAVRTAFSEYGKTQFPSQEDLAKTLSEYRRLGQLAEALADVQEGKAPKKSGPQRNKPTQNVREATAKLRAEMNKAGIETQSEEDQLASRNQARKTALENQIADLDKQLQTGEKPVRGGKPVPDSPEVERLKAERDAMQAEVDRIEAEANPPKTEAEKQVERLEKTKQQLDEVLSGVRDQKPAKQFEALSAEADRIKAEIDEMRKLASQMKRDAKPKTDPASAKERAQIKALEKAIDEYSRRVREGDFAAKTKITKPDSKRVAELKAIRDSRRSMYDVAKKAGKPVKTETEKRIEAAQRAIDRSIAETKRRIDEKDFTPKPKRSPVETKALLDARAESARLKNEYEEMKADYEFKQLPNGQKLWFGIKQGGRAFINILSSLDLSAPRQGAGYLLGAPTRLLSKNPLAGAKMTFEPFGKMFQALLSEKASARINQAIIDRPNRKNGVDKLSGVQFQDVDSPTFSKGEENAFSILDKWAKLPFKRSTKTRTALAALPLAGAKAVRASNRAFATFLNAARAMMLDELTSIHFKDHPPTKEQLRLIGDAVNLATGRSNIPQAAKTGLRYTGLWSPDLMLSRIQALGGQPLISAIARGEGKAARIIAQEYARVIAGGYLLLMMSRLFSDDDEKGKSKAVLEPTSSDFGKVIVSGKDGDTRVDPWGGFQQPTVLASRLAQSEKTDIEGDSKKLSGREKLLLLAQFYRSKLRPTVGIGVDIALGENFKGEKTTPESVAKSLLPVPLAWQETVKLFRQHGLSEAAALQALQMFGAGVNNYSKDEEVPKATR